MGKHDGRRIAGLEVGGVALLINGSGPAMNGTKETAVRGQGDDHLVTPLEAERRRLEAEIAEAEERKAAAERRAPDVTGALHAVVMRSKGLLAEIEQSHTKTIEAIRAQARDEIECITADAHRRVRMRAHPATDHTPEGTRQGVE